MLMAHTAPTLTRRLSDAGSNRAINLKMFPSYSFISHILVSHNFTSWIFTCSRRMTDQKNVYSNDQKWFRSQRKVYRLVLLQLQPSNWKFRSVVSLWLKHFAALGSGLPLANSSKLNMFNFTVLIRVWVLDQGWPMLVKKVRLERKSQEKAHFCHFYCLKYL